MVENPVFGLGGELDSALPPCASCHVITLGGRETDPNVIPTAPQAVGSGVAPEWLTDP